MGPSPYLEALRGLLHAIAEETMAARPATAMIRAKAGRCLAVLEEAVDEHGTLEREKARFRRKVQLDAVERHALKHDRADQRIEFEACRHKDCIEARELLRDFRERKEGR